VELVAFPGIVTVTSSNVASGLLVAVLFVGAASTCAIEEGAEFVGVETNGFGVAGAV